MTDAAFGRIVPGNATDQGGADPTASQLPLMALATLIGVAIVALYVTTIGYYTSPWMGDAAHYIEVTRSLLRGEPLLTRGPDGAAPMAIWPPGYPVLAAPIASLGVPAHQALLLLTRLSVAACVPALTWALLPVLSGRLALLTAVFGVLAPGLVSNANLASSDAVFCLVAILTAGCVVRDEWLWAGFLLSLGFCLRNAAMSLAPAVAAAAMLSRPAGFATLDRLLRLAAGGAPALVALILWNLLALGTMRPYAMPPSTRSLWINLADVSAALSFDLFPVYSIAHALPWVPVVAATGVLCVGLIAFAYLHTRRTGATERLLVFAGAYLGLGLAMIVYARTRYEWGEPIWERHTAQYDWLVLPALLVAWPLIAPRWRVSGMRLLGGVLLFGIILRVADGANRYLFYVHSAPVVAAIIETGNKTQMDPRLQLRQFFRQYERTPELAAFASRLNPACGVVTPIYDLLLALYDIPSAPTDRLAGPAPIVWLDAAVPRSALPDTAISANANPALRQVTFPDQVGGLQVWSNAPDFCLPDRKP